MNNSGKFGAKGEFDAKVSADGSGLHSDGHVHVETVHATHAPSDAIVVPDAHLLFNGEFKRSGVDLILSGDDQELVFHDYFKGEKRAALSSPDGAHLTGNIVNALTGHVDYAQADGSASASKVIGHVTKLVGTATAIRNGVSIILNNGDNVEKGDVLQSGANSTLGITFIDGTVFGLSSNARMVLNEMVYDPNGSNNSSLLSLVAGTITFVAGETAKHGDMKIDTPVATMGIRGTAVLVEIDFTVPGQGGTPDAKFQVLVEPDGTTGSYILFDKTTLTPLAVVDKAGQQINISNGVLSQTTNPLSPEIQKLITDVFSLKFSDNTNPNTNTHFTDSIVPQPLAPIQLASGTTAIPVILNLNDLNSPTFNSPPSGGPNGGPPPVNKVNHIDIPPVVVATGNALTVRTGASQPSGFDTVSGQIRFADVNASDLPTVKTALVSFKLLDAQHNDITATLTPQQIAAVAAGLVVTPGPGNNNNGSATWTYSVADSAFSFLTAGETLTLNYNALVDNNYLPNDQVTVAPFTITINAPSIVEWIHPAGDLWSVGSNWSSGAVPTAADDASIAAEHIPGGTGLYNVMIETPAFARNLTLNANNTTGGQVTNHSTLTIGEALTIFNNGVLNNSGAVSVGSQIELLNQSSLLNSGLITLGQGGDFKDQSNVSNSGTIELAGGTLNIQVDIANSGGIIQLDAGTTLKLNGAAINGGAINDNGTIDVTANSSINGTGANALLNNGGVKVENGVTLTLDNVTVNGTTFVGLATSSTLQIDPDAMLMLNRASINGGTINDNGLIDVTDDSSINGTATDILLNNGLVVVESDVTLTLDNVTVNGTTFADTAGGSILQIDDDTTLTLNDGVTIDGGTINDGTADGTGRIDVKGTVTIDSNATLNNGGVTIESDATLTLDNVTVNGTTFSSVGTIQVDDGTTLRLQGGAKINGGTINDGSERGTGIIDVAGATMIDGKATLNNGGVTIERGVTLTLGDVTVNGTTFTDTASGATIQVDSGDTLTLNNVTVTGGAITDNGTIDVIGAVTLDSGVTVNGGAISIARGATLDIENAVTGTGATLNGVDVANSGTIQVDGPVAGSTTINLLLEGGTTVTGGTLLIHVHFPTSSVEGTVEIGAGGATLDHVTVINNNSMRIDDGDTLTLSQVTINGGTIIAGTFDSVGGMIDVVDNSSINGTSTANAVLSNGGVTVESDVTLTLDNVFVSGTVFTDVDTSSIIQVVDGSTLMLSQVTINGGTILDGVADGPGGMIDVIGDSSINGTGTVNAILDNGGVTVEGDVTLTLDNVTVNRTIFTGLDTSSTIQVDGGNTLAFNGATINGGTLNVFGVMDSTGVSFITGAAIFNAGNIVVASGTLTIDPALLTNDGTIEVAGDSTLVLSGETVSNGANGKILVDATDSTHFSTLDLESSTIAGGAIIVAGLLDSTGNSVIADATITNTGTIDVISGTLDLENVTINGGTLGGAGTIDAVSGDNTLNGVTIADVTKLTVSNLATLDLTGTVTNNGELDITTGTVDITGNITGTGSIDIFSNAKLEIGGPVSSGETVTFGPSGGPVATAATLILDDSHHFQGTIVGLVENPNESLENHVDLKDLTFRPGDMQVSLVSGSLADGIFKVSNGIDFVDLHLSGLSSGTFEFAADATNGTLLDDPPASGTVTIDSGKTLDILAASTATVSFTNSSGNTGELVLGDSRDFTGKILGFAGDGTTSNSDMIKLADVNFADVAINKTTYSDNGNGTGTLTLYNANGQALDSLTFEGSYKLANFTIENDGSGHTLIVDPAASTSQAVASMVMNDPGPAPSSTIVASAPNQTLTGLAASDTFVFNFAGVGHNIVTDFHPDSDTLQFKSPIFASAQAAFNAAVDDGHGNTVIAIDSHDTITLSGVLKAQLHASDFHVV